MIDMLYQYCSVVNETERIRTVLIYGHAVLLVEIL